MSRPIQIRYFQQTILFSAPVFVLEVEFAALVAPVVFVASAVEPPFAVPVFSFAVR